MAAGSRGISAPVTLCECARPPIAEARGGGGGSVPKTFGESNEYELPLNISGIERVFLSLRGALEFIGSEGPLALASVCWVVVALLREGEMKACTLMRERRFDLGDSKCSASSAMFDCDNRASAPTAAKSRLLVTTADAQ